MDSTKLDPAATVIDLLGGINDTAALIERHRSVVNKWRLPKSVGGKGGAIPPKHWPTLVEANKGVTYDMLRGAQ